MRIFRSGGDDILCKRKDALVFIPGDFVFTCSRRNHIDISIEVEIDRIDAIGFVGVFSDQIFSEGKRKNFLNDTPSVFGRCGHIAGFIGGLYLKDMITHYEVRGCKR